MGFQTHLIKARTSKNERTRNIDIELLITHVELRPAIWNPRDPKYCNLVLIKKYLSKIADALQLGHLTPSKRYKRLYWKDPVCWFLKDLRWDYCFLFVKSDMTLREHNCTIEWENFCLVFFSLMNKCNEWENNKNYTFYVTTFHCQGNSPSELIK